MEDSRDEYLARWEIGLLAVIFLITIIGNFLVLFSLYLRHCHRGRGRKKLTRMYFFIMNLSIADLLNALLNVLPQLAWDVTFRFEGGPVLCKLVKFGQPLPTYLSSYILTATAIDRYQAICHPMSYRGTRSGRRSRAMVYGAWCVAIILCVPQIFVFSYKEIYPDVWDCWASFDEPYGQKAYVTWFGLTVFLIPLTALAYTYARICYGIWNKDGEIAKFARRDNGGDIGAGTCTERNRQPFVSRARLRTARQTVTVVSLYAITSSPFIGCQLWAAWDPNAASSPFFTGATFTILSLLSSLTSSVNPWIYLGFDRELRATLAAFLKKSVGLKSFADRDVSSNVSHGVGGASTRSSLFQPIGTRSSSSSNGQSARTREEQRLTSFVPF
ncbi:vasopressin V1a receptor-like isoform X2 [Venturia canescens]|uniref:vasopressin V1a receptor-like isoform X2 n=1 Tax=Venturia canescens TaxID=32260 RepID=UPI001C9BD884|nr:vasopressin V1a receptor-like isoform X2 [Venturia canescens]